MAALEYTVTMEDVLAFHEELEVYTGGPVVVELKVHVRLGHPLYWVEAHGYLRHSADWLEHICTGLCSYPSRAAATFPGALLNALMDCQTRWDSAMWLRKLEAQRREA